jgi:curved DNA-binding protein CbpA
VPDALSEDYYALLGAHPAADAAELRRIWRKVARRWHPDHAGPGATAMFQKVSAAYAVLSDPVTRAAYDRRRGVASKPPVSRTSEPARAPEPPRRRAPSIMLTRLSGPINGLLACGAARWSSREILELFLNAREAAQGGMITIAMRVQVRRAQGIGEELFSAWLAVPPLVADGTMLDPSVPLPGAITPVRFRIRVLPPPPSAAR